MTGSPGDAALSDAALLRRHHAFREVRTRILALDPLHDLRSFLSSAAGILMEHLGADACAVVARFPESARDFHLLVPLHGEAIRRERPLGTGERNRDLPAPEPGERDGFFYPPFAGMAAEAGVVPARVWAAPVRARGRVIVGIELVRPDPGLVPGPEPLQDLVDGLAAAFEVAFLLAQLRRERLEARLLQEVGQELGSTLDLHELLTTILDLLRQVVPYDAAVIYLLGEDGLDVVHQSLRGYPAGQEEIVSLKVGQGIVGSVARTGAPEIVPRVLSDPRYYNARAETRAEMVAPLKSGGRVIGVFNLESDRPDAYTAHDLELLEGFAGQAAVALERARLLERERNQRRLEQELGIARRIQRYFLPKLPENVARRGLDARTLPNEEVSGDYYDFLERKDGTLAVAVADVSGKGIPAALISAGVRTAFRLTAAQRSHPSVLCREMNVFLADSLRETEFVTGVFGVLDDRRRSFRYCNAGHNPPLWLHRDGAVEWLSTGGTILGVFPHADYEEEVIEMEEGDLLVLYTDGVTEAMDAAEEEFGTGRLVEVVRAHAAESPRALVDAVIDAVRTFAEGALPDDLTLVVIAGGAAAREGAP